jgi:hypothetical protein
MNKLFVRLAVAGAVAVGVAAPAAVLADSASIDLTGPFSTNVVTNSNRNSFNSLMFNRAALGNWNNQYARFLAGALGRATTAAATVASL